ncbi:hypothetical protein JR316_0007033 [Psilocybe cubensis]|uniref:Uncharacterized protein n=2 Tax=Psilocybe cubensis TaxID=181762 RepID=A0ACB8GY31_PSICU|nr:hypothetical protein JR316_0007033 [Psilocybe cubensis]KAH9480433.1 hypothetical protein JR316_0007033 [Psilocybe cubensis]
MSNSIPDEVLQLIFYELPDPSPFTRVSQRFYRFSQDPYVRAHYFLNHYGPAEAMYYAMGRGKVVTERVLDILLTSGAHISRYLIQVAGHHYFHTQNHFVKTTWVRQMPLQVVAYFLKLAEQRYGQIPWGKGEDDGSIFMTFLKESRLPAQIKSVTWETIKTLMDTYNFIPFCSRDPIMSQFPLALAIEPRLLPYASANGFSLDYKYRDFVFRKMFERPSPSSDIRAEDIAQNVRELCKLDSAMFVTRTVAAEVCMEAKTNELGYAALKQLDKSGDLRFDLSILVEDLLRTFLTTRSICSVTTGDILLHLFTDFPSTDVAVRLVVLVLVFLAADNLHMSTTAIRAKLEALGVMPLTRKDVFNVLINPFIERYNYVLDFAKQEVGIMDDGTKGMSAADIDSLVEDVALKCLEIGCKGKLLNRLQKAFPSLLKTITDTIIQKYSVELEDLPCWEETPVRQIFVAKLCRDFLRFGLGEVHTLESLQPDAKPTQEVGKCVGAEAVLAQPLDEEDADPHSTNKAQSIVDLGAITQESLTAMIRHDEITPVRSRRRIFYNYGPSGTEAKLRYPQDPLHVGKWAKSIFDPKSIVMSIFMTHAIINDNCNMLHHYVMHSDYFGGIPSHSSSHIPVTLKHFQLLARLGRCPNPYLYHSIEAGAPFYVDEKEYISKSDLSQTASFKQRVKSESPQSVSMPPNSPSSPSTSTSRGRKRPRRSAAVSVRSYAVPDSDDEAIAEDRLIDDQEDKKAPRESHLQLWIKHLTQLLKVETRKCAEIKKRLESCTNPETRSRFNKNEFVKSLTNSLRNLRKQEAETRQKYPHDDLVDDYSDNEDDDDYATSRRPKKRKTATYA